MLYWNINEVVHALRFLLILLNDNLSSMWDNEFVLNEQIQTAISLMNQKKIFVMVRFNFTSTLRLDQMGLGDLGLRWQEALCGSRW